MRTECTGIRIDAVRGWLVVVVMGCALLSGCAEPQPARSSGTTGAVGAQSFGQVNRRVAVTGPMATRVASLRGTLRRFVPSDDLVDELYFGWMLEPYRRATLAIAVKALHVLEREAELRERGRGVLTEGETDALCAWLTDALEGDFSPVAAGFAPDEFRAEWSAGSVQCRGAAVGPLRLFTFADRSSTTQADRWFGDFDLLACAGSRIYPVGRNRPLEPGDVDALRAHANAMGIGIVGAPLPSTRQENEALQIAATSSVVPVTLRQILAGDVPRSGTVAVIDPPHGESWGGMIARRALFRGITGRPAPAVGCVAPKGDRDMAADRIRAAMWIQAAEGQPLGIVEGWRDFRDGTATTYASRFAEPLYLETVAHTGLDIIRHRELLARFRAAPKLALVVSEAHLREGKDNEWSKEADRAFRTLLHHGVRYDLLAKRVEASRRESYDLIVTLPATAELGPDSRPRLLYSKRGAEKVNAAHVSGENLDEVLTAATRIVALFKLHVASGSDLSARSLLDIGGDSASAYVQSASSGLGGIVVKLDSTPLGLKLVVGAENASGLKLRDALTGETVKGDAITMDPYQVRLLVPVDG